MKPTVKSPGFEGVLLSDMLRQLAGALELLSIVDAFERIGSGAGMSARGSRGSDRVGHVD
jgi:hypothetical protein